MSKFNYFAYGSNVNTERIRLSAASATPLNIGFIENYKLHFSYFSDRWQGAVATIIPCKGTSVWGVVWNIDHHDKQKLDLQENIKDGLYAIENLKCTTKDNITIDCYAYVLKKLDDCHLPSKLYKSVIIKGAKEHNLPQNYISGLENISDNGFDKNFEEYKHNLAILST